ncbi:MAG: hypothetical protein J0H65_05480 [Rhizobiales bacterium]|nr:hypothetical protein [Hyphomicrobiales bacterium]
MNELDEHRARSVLETAHGAWCDRDVERLLDQYVEDCTYWCNAGVVDGEPFTLTGKQAFRPFLHSILLVADSRSVIELFQFKDGIARAQISAYVRHRRTGHVLAGLYRQVVTYRGNRIWRIEEYHDAAKMNAFWRLVASEEAAVESK